jgi:hypothetical protein
MIEIKGGFVIDALNYLNEKVGQLSETSGILLHHEDYQSAIFEGIMALFKMSKP